MYTIQNISILKLQLDAKNPRFILPDTGENQENIRKYLLEQEDALTLTKDIVDYGGLMPGERIVATKENDQYVVLEGNRRTCACQMLVDRSLIPENFANRIPPSSDLLVKAISNIDIDIIPTREEARRFLATRHIERAREWSTIAKMRFCYEDHAQGKSVSKIKERTGLSTNSINKYLRNYKILIRGLESSWSPTEKQKLFILDIKPDKLIRIFGLADTKRVLQLYFDDQYNLQSNLITKTDLDEIIHIWTRKAFIDDEMDTRTPFGELCLDGGSTGACGFIEHILKKYYDEEDSSTGSGTSTGDNSSTGSGPCTDENPSTGSGTSTGDNSSTGSGTSTDDNSSTGSGTSAGGGPSLSHFFGALDWSNVSENEHNGKGVIAVCKELRKISNTQSFIDSYPICTAFIIRALIEQSLKFYAKKNGYWAVIMQDHHASGRNNGDPQLSYIIKEFNTYLTTWIPDQNIRRMFNIVFNNQVQVDKFNLVVHSPECYTLSPDTLKSIPNEGLLAIANYFLT